MIAYQVATESSTCRGQTVCWEILPEAPYLEQVGNDAFVRIPFSGSTRAYVNGVPVVGGIQVLRDQDLVTIVAPGTAEISYIVSAHHSVVEPGNGRRCSFTGMPIGGTAVRCCQCNRVVAEAVAHQLEACPGCTSPLDGVKDRVSFAEELQ